LGVVVVVGGIVVVVGRVVVIVGRVVVIVGRVVVIVGRVVVIVDRLVDIVGSVVVGSEAVVDDLGVDVGVVIGPSEHSSKDGDGGPLIISQVLEESERNWQFCS